MHFWLLSSACRPQRCHTITCILLLVNFVPLLNYTAFYCISYGSLRLPNRMLLSRRIACGIGTTVKYPWREHLHQEAKIAGRATQKSSFMMSQ